MISSESAFAGHRQWAWPHHWLPVPPMPVIAQDDVAVQQKVTVTGSRIKRVDIEGPSPTSISKVRSIRTNCTMCTVGCLTSATSRISDRVYNRVI